MNVARSWLKLLVADMVIAANESEFWPAVCSNPEFADWVTRTASRLCMARGASDAVVHRAICWEGVPPPDWANGMAFLISLSKPKIYESALAAAG